MQVEVGYLCTTILCSYDTYSTQSGIRQLQYMRNGKSEVFPHGVQLTREYARVQDLKRERLQCTPAANYIVLLVMRALPRGVEAGFACRARKCPHQARQGTKMFDHSTIFDSFSSQDYVESKKGS